MKTAIPTPPHALPEPVLLLEPVLRLLRRSKTVEQLVLLLGYLPRQRLWSLGFLLPVSVVPGLIDLATVTVVGRLIGVLIGADLPNQVPWVRLFGGPDYDQTLWLVSLFILLSWLAAFTKLGLDVAQQKLTSHILEDLSARIHANVLNQEYDYHLTSSTASLTSLVLNNVKAAARLVIFPLLQMVGASLSLLILTAGVLFVGRRLAVVVLSLVVVCHLAISLGITPFLRRANEQILRLDVRSTNLLMESLSSIRDVHLAHAEPHFQREFVDTFTRSRRYAWMLESLPTLPRMLVEPFGITLIFSLGAIPPLLRGDIEQVRQVMPFLATLAFAGLRLMPPLQDVFASISQLRGGLPTVAEAVKLLELPQTRLTLASSGVPRPAAVFPRHTIRLHDVWYRYGGRPVDDDPDADQPASSGQPESAASARLKAPGEWVLKALDLTIPVGTRVALVGPTGSGKTTTAHVLLGLLEPQRGCLTLDGLPLTDEKRPAWQASCAQVPQLIQLLGRSVQANVAFGVPDDEIDRERIWDALEAARLADLVAQLPHGLMTAVGENGVQFSGGQRQRLALARAFYRQASFLLLDEATSALDNRTESEVVNALEVIGRRCTTVVIAHRLATVSRCDRIYELENGRIKASGSFEELRESSPSFAELVRLDRL